MSHKLFEIGLLIHSWNRWVVLVLIIGALISAFIKRRQKTPYSVADKRLQKWMIWSVYIQGLVGIYLYINSPISQFFLKHPGEGISLREIRFFGLEHITVMLLAIAIFTLGFIKTNRASTTQEKNKISFRWIGMGFLLILSSIPWSFSPLISRPLFRL